jgi:3-hydroxy-3-methylglutaryl CoA synthase
MAGIVSYGGYVPRYRLNRKLIFKAMGWMDPATAANARGEKAVANFDEDSITMAVAAGIASLQGMERSSVGGVYFASTTLPYKERLNAGIISLALGLSDHIRAADFTGGLKAGTTALLSALETAEAGRAGNIVVAASDSRLGRPASGEEMIFGDAATAFLVGSENVIAEFKGSYSLTCDFGDHFRGEFAKYDRKWEDRWVRDIGFDHFVPMAIRGLLSQRGLKITDFKKVIYDCHYTAARGRLNKVLGISPEMEQPNLQAEVGQCGTAQSLLMLAGALDTAEPGDKLLVVSFGSGCDALCFEVTENIRKQRQPSSITRCLANRADLDVYEKYLVWRDILPAETGLRSEEDLWTRWSLLWRKRREVMGLWGSRCRECGTPQYPPQRVCVNPQCGAVDKMEEYLFSDKLGRILSYTADMLAPSFNPPAIYGAVEFEGGGKYYFDFTDCKLDGLSVGMPVTFSFRRKYYDKLRGISGYFWKAVPVKEVK